MKSTPIIAISGGGGAMNADQALEALKEKADLVLKKPFSKKDLLDQVAKLAKTESTPAGPIENVSIE